MAYPARSAARLLAVQALYQMELAESGLDHIISEYKTHRIADPLQGLEPEADTDRIAESKINAADADFFESILRQVIGEQITIDRQIDAYLSKDWRLSRLDSTLRALLRCGVCELLYFRDIAAQIIIAEYTDMAHSFFSGKEGGMVNALLDRLAQAIQTGDVA